MANGWERLGRALGGSRAASDAAFRQRLGDNLTLGSRDQALQQAIMETVAKRGIRERLEGAGVDPAQAALGEFVLQGGMGSDYSAFQQGRLREQEMGFRQSAVDAPTLDAANRYLVGVANGPVDLTKISGGTAYNPLVSPGSAPMVTTAVGDSVIGANRALAGQRAAQAQATLGRFNLQREGKWNPSGQSGGSRGGAYTVPSSASIERLLGDQVTDEFGGKTTVVDPMVVRDFEVWRQANPQYRSGEEALAAYAAQRRSTGGGIHFIDPSLPGSMTISPPAPARPKSKAEYDALPSGTQFMAPDGTMRIKP